jgi:hypothetical protein
VVAPLERRLRLRRAVPCAGRSRRDHADVAARPLELDGRLDDWAATREAIRAWVLQDGWSERLQSFRQTPDDDELDAANLLVPLVGFLEPDDPRTGASTRRPARCSATCRRPSRTPRRSRRRSTWRAPAATSVPRRRPSTLLRARRTSSRSLRRRPAE